MPRVPRARFACPCSDTVKNCRTDLTLGSHRVRVALCGRCDWRLYELEVPVTVERSGTPYRIALAAWARRKGRQAIAFTAR